MSPLPKATSLIFFTFVLRHEIILLFFQDDTKLFSLLMRYDSSHHSGHAFFAGSNLFVLSEHCFLKFIFTQVNRIVFL